MIEFRLGVGDLASTWFAYSALQETVLSLRTRHTPANYPEQQAWTTPWRSGFPSLDHELLGVLTTPRGFAPDFLTPRPRTHRPDFQAELAVVAATRPERVRENIRTAFACDGSPLPDLLALGLDDPSELLARIVGALEGYWRCCLEPAWWPRARAVLEADIAYRGRMLSERGAEGLFADLDARVSWADGILTVTDRNHGVPVLPAPIPVAGRGLVLIPTMFALGALTDISPEDGSPLITYPTRGKATMAEGLARPPEPAVAPALAELIGLPRARLLMLLQHPASTTELAHRLGVTAGAVSRHLGALTAAGLLARTRHGRSVHYHRSALGDHLASGSN